MSSPSGSTLSGLVSSTPHLLAYCIPLLLSSIPLTFAGTFLTLDRSRSFAPSYSPAPLPGGFDRPKKKLDLTWLLRGGIGGLASGYIFGLHLSTFLTLLVPAVSASAPLSSNAFLAIWILCCISACILGGRYKYCALFFSAFSGGALLALALSVIFHPPLLSRVVLVILFSVATSIIVLVSSIPRFSRYLHGALRIAMCSTGAFSLILSIALLAHIPAWANVWERLWLNGHESWGSSKERGLNAAFCIFMFVGIGTDWSLKRWLGECPDEKWDKYLANYTSNLPNDSSRAGTFNPLPSFWERHFHFDDRKDIGFPGSPEQAKTSISKDGLGLLSGIDGDHAQDPPKAHPVIEFPGFRKHSSPDKFKPEGKKVKHKTKNTTPSSRGRKPVKFGGDLSSDSVSDSDFSDVDKVRPWLNYKESMASSTQTLVEHLRVRPPLDYDLELTHLRKGLVKAGEVTVGDQSDYSDYEGDVGLQRKPPRKKEDMSDDWSPGFMKRHSSSSANASVSGSLNENMNHAAIPVGAVPATPSLIKALDRVAEAQRNAFGLPARGPLVNSSAVNGAGVPPIFPAHKAQVDGMPRVEEHATDGEEAIRDDAQQNKPRWDDFWRDVTEKARS